MVCTIMELAITRDAIDAALKRLPRPGTRDLPVFMAKRYTMHLNLPGCVCEYKKTQRNPSGLSSLVISWLV